MILYSFLPASTVVDLCGLNIASSSWLIQCQLEQQWKGPQFPCTWAKNCDVTAGVSGLQGSVSFCRGHQHLSLTQLWGRGMHEMRRLRSLALQISQEIAYDTSIDDNHDTSYLSFVPPVVDQTVQPVVIIACSVFDSSLWRLKQPKACAPLSWRCLKAMQHLSCRVPWLLWLERMKRASENCWEMMSLW